MAKFILCEYICILIAVKFLVVMPSELAHVRCFSRTVHCSCEDGSVRTQDGVRQCYDEITNSCKICVDEKITCAKRCSLGMLFNVGYGDLAKSRKRRGTDITCHFDLNTPKGKPVIKAFASQTVTEGSRATLYCNINSNPKPSQIKWTFKPSNGATEEIKCVGRSSKTDYYCELCDQRLIFLVATKENEGLYTCYVQNSVGNESKEAQLLVEKLPEGAKPIIVSLELSSNENYVLYEGRSVNLTCKSYLGQRLSWWKNGRRFHEDDLHIIHQPVGNTVVSGLLEFKNISFNDSGHYECRMSRLTQPSYTSDTINITTAQCPGGHFCSPNNDIFICPSGSYCPANSFHPISCSIGFYCPEGSDKALICPDGFRCPKPSVRELIKKDESPDDKMSTIVLIIGLLVCVIVIFVVGVLVWKHCHKESNKSENFSNSFLSKHFKFTDDILEPADGERGLDAENKNTPERNYEWDVFICYSSKDGEWVRDYLMVEIEKRGLRACIDIRDFVPGEAIVQNIVDAIYGSRKTVAVLSPNYVKSEWCKDELQRAVTRGVHRHQVVPILYKPCRVPRLLQNKTYLDWNNEEVKPHFWDLLEKALQPDLRISAV